MSIILLDYFISRIKEAIKTRSSGKIVAVSLVFINLSLLNNLPAGRNQSSVMQFNSLSISINGKLLIKPTFHY